MPKETENWDGLGTMASYARDLRHATERAVWKARAEWEQEKAEAIAAAVAAEREACAALADEYHIAAMPNLMSGYIAIMRNTAQAIAARIRSRASGGNGGGEEL